MLHTAEISKAGNNVHFMTQDTCVMVLALQRLTVLGLETTMLIGTGDNRRKMLMKPIYVRLRTSKAAELPGLHCLTEYIKGHIKGIGKKTLSKKTLLLMLFQAVRGFCAGSWAQKKTYRPTQLKNWGGSAFRANLGIDEIPNFCWLEIST